jgi:hypothetical protein
MNSSISPGFSSTQLISFSFIAIVMFSTVACSKDDSPAVAQSATGTPLTAKNSDIYFSMDYKGKNHISYGIFKYTFVPADIPQSAYLQAKTKTDAAGEQFTEITISVYPTQPFVLSVTVLGDLEAHIQMKKKGSDLTGLYTKLSRDSISGVNGIYPYDIAFTNQGGYIIDTAGLELNIKKEDTLEKIGGDYVEGDFQFNLLNQVGLTDKTHVTGTFRLYKY